MTDAPGNYHGATMPTPSERIDDLIANTPDWRGRVFARLRKIIHEADPQITETWKWVTANRPGTPIFEHDGIVCHINILKERVKLTFAEGSSLPDPRRLFNADLENKRKAIDIREGDQLDEAGLRALVRAGVEQRLARKPARKRTGERSA